MTASPQQPIIAVREALAALNDLFGYEGSDLVEGIRAVAAYTRSLEQRQSNIIDPMASLSRITK